MADAAADVMQHAVEDAVTSTPAAEAVEGHDADVLEAVPPSSAASLFSRVGTLMKEGVQEVKASIDKAAATAKRASSFTNPKDGSESGSTLPAAAQEKPSTGTSHSDDKRMTNTLLEAAAGITKLTREGGVAAYEAAITSIRRLTAPTRRVAAVCKADLRTKPVPQVLLLTCNLVASQGLSSQGLFDDVTDPALAAQVEQLAALLEDRLLLLPADLNPLVAAAIIKHFLTSLEEPLLTYRLMDRWIAAGKALSAGQSEGIVHDLLAELPLVNWSSLKLLMETAYRVASQFNVTGKNALGLATSLAPALIWHENGPSQAADRTGAPNAAIASQGMVNQASQMASSALQALKSRLLSTPPADSKGPGSAPAGTGPTEAGVVSVPPVSTRTQSSPTKAPPPAVAASAAKQHVVLDEHEEEAELADPLERTVVQAGETQLPRTEPAGSAGAARGRAPLSGENLEAVITLVEHLILNYDDLFLAST